MSTRERPKPPSESLYDPVEDVTDEDVELYMAEQAAEEEEQRQKPPGFFNLQTGSGYGDYDLTWLLHALTVDPGTGRLAVTAKGVSAVEAYLQARYHMYRNVYFHKVVRAAEGMVKMALHRAKRLLLQGRLDWNAMQRQGQSLRRRERDLKHPEQRRNET